MQTARPSWVGGWGAAWAAAWLLWLAACAAPSGQPIQLSPPPSPPPLLLQVSGAVAQPGVYQLPPGARAQDLIAAAGGLLPQADEQALNLVAPLQDGQRLIVPFRPTPRPTPDPSQPAPSGPGGGPTPTTEIQYPLNVNTASQAELESLPGVGPVTAQNIIAYRQAHGPFQALEDLDRVPGIGPVTLEKLAPWVTVGP
jgi:competence protein ComEA